MHFCVSLYDGIKVTKVIKVSKEDEKEMIIIAKYEKNTYCKCLLDVKLDIKFVCNMLFQIRGKFH